MLGDRLLPERITHKRIEPSGRTSSFLVKFRNYKTYKGSPADFSLTQFGLPEPVGASSIYQRQAHWYLWFIAAGVFSLAVAAFLWRRVQRRKLALEQAGQPPLRKDGS
jgi:hypothetical protein